MPRTDVELVCVLCRQHRRAGCISAGAPHPCGPASPCRAAPNLCPRLQMPPLQLRQRRHGFPETCIFLPQPLACPEFDFNSAHAGAATAPTPMRIWRRRSARCAGSRGAPPPSDERRLEQQQLALTPQHRWRQEAMRLSPMPVAWQCGRPFQCRHQHRAACNGSALACACTFLTALYSAPVTFNQEHHAVAPVDLMPSQPAVLLKKKLCRVAHHKPAGRRWQLELKARHWKAKADSRVTN